MKKKEKKREAEIEQMFKVYNGSASIYKAPKIPNKTIAKICSKGSKLAKGTDIGQLLNEIRE